MACCGLGKCLGATLTIVGRAILTLCCLALLFEQVYWILLADQQDGQHAPVNFSYRSYFARGALLGVALAGLYAVYTRELRHLKLFALLLLFLATISGIQAYQTYSNSHSSSERLSLLLRQSQPHYVWRQEGKHKDEISAFWDDLQSSLECCGIGAPEDWKSSRPPSAPKDLVPDSCCSAATLSYTKDHMCHTRDAYRLGCADKFRREEDRYFYRKLVETLNYVTMALLAMAVAKPRVFQLGPASDVYQRFDGSVYVRRPVAEPSQKPPTYVAATAPPSYGMV